jgi:hypothetical protein
MVSSSIQVDYLWSPGEWGLVIYRTQEMTQDMTQEMTHDMRQEIAGQKYRRSQDF